MHKVSNMQSGAILRRSMTLQVLVIPVLSGDFHVSI